MKRHSLVLRAKTFLSQKLPADLEGHVARFHDLLNASEQNTSFNWAVLALNLDDFL